MERKNLKIGDVLVTTRRMKVYDSYGNIRSNIAVNKNFSFEKGALFECISANGDSLPVIKLSGTQYTFTVANLIGFELTNNHDTSQRQKKAKHLAEEIASTEQEIASLEERCSIARNELVKKREKLSNLERFTSDDEELAFTLAEVIRVGADEKAILKLLQERSATDKL